MATRTPTFSGLLLCFASHLATGQLPAYPGIPLGPYSVGYQTRIDFDYSRTYNLSFPGDSSSRAIDPRPVLTHMWYPAKVSGKDKWMVFGDYIHLETKDEKARDFLSRIQAYNEKNSAFYMFYENTLNEKQKLGFHSRLQESVPVYRNAKPLGQRFPLVLYHPGLGGTLNDNTILCEYLASYGFVVVTSSFHGNDFREVDLDWDLERSGKDLDIILNVLKDYPFIDFTKMAAIGHSFGAQAVLAYKTTAFSPLSALVILDTTMDYEVAPRGFKKLIQPLYQKISRLDVPMLVFSNPTAVFTVIDSLKYSDRLYATMPLDHNDFTSLTAYAKMKRLMPDPAPDSVWTKYTVVAQYCLHYLKAKLCKEASSSQFLDSKQPFTKVYPAPPGKKFIDQVPDYTDYSRAPSYLQLQKLIIRNQKQIIQTILEQHPAYLNQDDINAAGYTILEKDPDFALLFFEKNVALHPESWHAWNGLGEGYAAKGDKASAIKSLSKSVLLNPKNTDAIRMIEKLKQ